MDVYLREAGPVDDNFLLGLYRSTRTEEIASWRWSEAQADNFLKFQYEAQKRHYLAQFPEAEHQVIVFQGVDLGRIMTARLENEIRLIDIAVLPQYRNRGIGSKLIESLLIEAESSGRTVRLSVEKNNPAVRLYQRLGLVATGDTGVHYAMEWRAKTKNEIRQVGSEVTP